MKFDSNPSSGAYSLYTGVTNLEAVLINPNLTELQAFNPNAKKEPVYEQGVVEIWLKNEDVFVPVRFNLKKEIRNTLAGDKKVFMNDFGQSTYAPSREYILENYIWFNPIGLREAYVGEVELMSFFRSYLAVPVKGSCAFDNREAIFEGNLTEVISTFKTHNKTKEGNTRQVKIGLSVTSTETENGVKRYHRVFNRYFEPSWMTRLTSWEKALYKEDGSPNYSGDMQNSLEYKKYVAPTESVVAPKTADLPF